MRESQIFIILEVMLFTSILTFLAAVSSVTASPINENTNAAAAPPVVYLNALGMGVKNKAASTTFYGKVFGVKKSASMPVPNMGKASLLAHFFIIYTYTYLCNSRSGRMV
jgi:hypothetical protein